jgi:hypothetical protein
MGFHEDAERKRRLRHSERADTHPNNPETWASNANNSQLFFTDPFPATTGMDAGNSDIDGRVPLPSTCFAPLVFVTSPATATNANGVWFAVTGFSPGRFKADNDGDDN